MEKEKKMQQNYLLLVLFFLCFSVGSGSGQSDDIETLLELKKSFVANPKDENILRNWNSSDSDFCNWTGVTCGGGVVVGLNLSGLGLSGSISPSIGRFNSLTQLDLSSNSLVGPIPATLSNLSSSLETLHLFTNKLSGQIPTQVGSLVNLISLKIGDNELVGSIPESFGNLFNLQILAVASCRLTGQIPSQLGRLVRIKSLILQDNMLEGPIPPELGNCTAKVLGLSETKHSGEMSKCESLQVLDLSKNALTGPIPDSLFQLVGLTNLFLYNNSLEGKLSPSISNLTNLHELSLSSNYLEGKLPKEIGSLRKLQIMYLSENRFSGEIPIEIWNCTNLISIGLYGNHLSGEISSSIGILKKLFYLDLRENQFVGNLPATLGNCNQLNLLDLADNHFSGSIPSSFGFLKALDQFHLYNNYFQGNLPNSLINLKNLTRITFSGNKFNGSISPLCGSSSYVSFDVTGNRFEGEIPSELADSSNLDRLRLGQNQFTGRIPWTFGKIRELSLLDISSNYLTGIIPKELGLCKKLTHIDLNNNFLSGVIPPWLGNLPLLGELNLSSNRFIGSLPTDIFNLTNLLVLSLDGNSLNGSIPQEIGNLEALTVLNLERNQISGPIPSAIGKLSLNLYELRLSRNNLTGYIPVEIGQLKFLQSLDLSHNQLVGEVPGEIGEIQSLSYLNLSYNNLAGKLKNQFSKWKADAFVGNAGLCGSPLSNCNRAESNKNGLSAKTVIIVSAIASLAAIALMVLVIILFCNQTHDHFKRGGKSAVSSDSSSSQAPLFRNGAENSDIKWQDIMKATHQLNNEFMIGSGGSGKVYKAELANGETIAVKKILLKDDLMLNKSFNREIKTLGRIRHRHLVKLMGYCNSKAEGLNLLIYEFMENGSVWDWIHSNEKTKKKEALVWEARLRIAVGLAQGVEYLHHDCVPPIVHRDIKSSNVLLDSNMEAHLGDFGLAKILTENNDTNTESNTLFAGSYGYIAPEYAYSLKATEKSDVYSFGIVLMEIVTGKMPTDKMFNEESGMVKWVESVLEMSPDSAREKLIDSELEPLLPCDEAEACQVLEIALQCTKTYPQERPSSRKACDCLLSVFNNRAREMQSDTKK